MYAKIENNVPVEWPVQAFQIRSAFSYVSFPAPILDEDVLQFGFEPYRDSKKPTVDDLIEVAEEVAPVKQADGAWLQQWQVVEKYSPEERERLLAEREVERELQFRKERVSRNNSAYEQAITLMTADYPASEISTWERQRAEVIAWEADNAVATPWIDIAASARGLDRDTYLVRTLAKVKAFAQASAWLTGRRQGIDDAIRAATTLEELQAIVIDYTLPGGTA